MSSIMRCRSGLMALPVMRDAPVLIEVANPSSQDRTPHCAIPLATAPAAAPYRASGLVLWRIVLKKSFWGDDQNFSGPLMRFARGDMRDHIVSHKNDHGSSYRPYRALQRLERLKINFREIFGTARFSTFATLSAQSGHSSTEPYHRRGMALS